MELSQNSGTFTKFVEKFLHYGQMEDIFMVQVLRNLEKRFGFLYLINQMAEQLPIKTIMVDALDAQIEMPSNWITAAKLPPKMPCWIRRLCSQAKHCAAAWRKEKASPSSTRSWRPTPESMADTLVEQLAKAPDGEFEKKLELLHRYLQRIAVEIEQEQS